MLEQRESEPTGLINNFHVYMVEKRRNLRPLKPGINNQIELKQVLSWVSQTYALTLAASWEAAWKKATVCVVNFSLIKREGKRHKNDCYSNHDFAQKINTS